MQLTNEEKSVLVSLLKVRLEEVQENKKLTNTPVKMFAAEANYEEILKSILKKLSQ